MSSDSVYELALTSHPDSRGGPVRRVRARVCRTPQAILAVNYRVEGDLARVRVPVPRPPRLAGGLWRHTCCEVFIARGGLPGYHEFNFAPSGEWAAYAFERYRERARLHESGARLSIPRVAMRSSAEELELEASIPLGQLSPAHACARLSLALAAVFEDEAGTLSYWALRHSPGRPDFHHPDAFALELDELRD
jgi:hypothetical protein